MEPGEITSRSNERVKQAARIAASAAARRETGLFFAEGRRLCLDLAASLTPQTAFFTKEACDAHPGLAHLAAEGCVIAPHVADKLAVTGTTQGVYALFPLPRATLAALPEEQGILLCERVQDPANIGAMLRSAAAFGFGGAVLGPGCADPFSPRALRASAGAAARLAVVWDAPLPDAAAALKARGHTLYAAAGGGAVPLPGLSPKHPLALMIGNEGAGLTEEALALADATISIPMARGVESLNAAVAASVLMYQLGPGSRSRNGGE